MPTTRLMSTESTSRNHTAEISQQGSDRPAHMERRRYPRRPYRCIQRIAACQEFVYPAGADFHPVRCNDISQGGISFFYPQQPPFARCVIELGPPRILMFAQLVYTLEVPGENAWLVACEFKGRAAA